jgi:Holliday junction DNA helicase RuvA
MMYAWIGGRVAWVEEDSLVIVPATGSAAGGLGMRIRVLPDLLASAREDEHLELFLHHITREDAELLVGFQTRDEERLFATLLDVSGVGPKVALALLATHGAQGLRRALVDGNEEHLATAPGVGRRLAARIIVELRERMARDARIEGDGEAGRSRDGDLEAALRSLGFPTREARALVASVNADRELASAPLTDRLRAALKERGA